MAIKLEMVLSANVAQFIAETERSQKKATALSRVIGFVGRDLKTTGLHALSAAKAFTVWSTAIIAVAGPLAGVYATLRGISGLNQASEVVDKLGKASKRLGISVRDLSALRLAALDADVEFEQVAQFAGKAQKNIAQLVADGKTVLRLGQMNVRLTDFAGRVRGVTELLPDLAKGIDSASSSAEKIRLADSIFGRGGGEAFLQLLTDGGDYIRNLADQTERARKLGVLFTDDQVKRLTAYNDAITHLGQAWLGIKVQIVNAVAPVVTEFLESSAERLARMPALIRAAAGAATSMIGGSRAGSSASREALGSLRDAGSQAIRITALEVGRLLGTAFVEAVKVGLAAIGPSIEDLFRDALGPVLNAIPGVNVERSERGKLTDLRSRLKETGSLVREIADLQNTLDNDPRLDGYDRDQTAMALVRAQARLAAMRAEENQVRAQEKAVELQAIARANILADATVTAFRETETAAESASTKIRAAWRDFDTAADSVIAMYDAASPPEEKRRALPNFFKIASDLATGLSRRVGIARTAVGQFLEEATQKATAAMELAMELEERSLAAGGDETGSRRLRMLRQFMKEQREITENFGALADPLLAKLREVQAAELLSFDLEPLEKLNERLKDMAADGRGGAAVVVFIERIEDLRNRFKRGEITIEEFRAEIERLKGDLQGLSKKVKEEFGDKLENAISGFATSASDAFADLVVDGKASFDQLAKSWTKTLISMALQHYLFQPIFSAVGAEFGGLFPKTPKPSAAGNVFSRGNLVPFAAGGVVMRPAVFPMANGGIGLMGEAGPEAIMPLKRINGKLGVQAAAGGTMVQIIDQRSGGAPVQVRESTGPDGRKVIQALVRDEVAGMVRDGTMDQVLGGSYRVARRPARR